ncbi:hypothetical protein L2U69_03105 [Zavarzinia compransoris]|uniref:hypothetical protein n=1 Tax=Zavarzinia marina TaxID=2911065 RepID=UPI001F31FD71|nr:hypothetical protein [Zavarzinia marina]MCF4164632.1 hypothetical protein [Zavarzinia marina]
MRHRLRQSVVFGAVLAGIAAVPWGFFFRAPSVNAIGLWLWIVLSYLVTGIAAWFVFARDPMTWSRRLLIGVAIAYLSAAVFIETAPLLLEILGMDRGEIITLALFGIAGLGAFAVIPVSLVTMVVGALPILRPSMTESRLMHHGAIAGAYALLVGIVMAISFSLPDVHLQSDPEKGRALIMALGGAFSAGLLWFGAFRRQRRIDFGGVVLVALLIVPVMCQISTPILTMFDRFWFEHWSDASIMSLLGSIPYDGARNAFIIAPWAMPVLGGLTLAYGAWIDGRSG